MRLVALIADGDLALLSKQDESSLRQLGYAASLVQGCLDDPQDNLGKAIRIAAAALEGRDRSNGDFRDPVQAGWGARWHLDAAKLRLETPLHPDGVAAASKGDRMTASRALPAELINHLSELSRRLGPLAEPLQAWIAGDFALHYYTQHRILLPPDMHVFEINVPGSEAGKQVVVMDGNFNDVLGSFPPDWEKRSHEVQRIGSMLLHVIDPVDLAVSKVARFSERDREDIRALAGLGPVDPEDFAGRGKEALDYYVGDLTFVRNNLADAGEIIRSPRNLVTEAAGAPVPKPDERENDNSRFHPFLSGGLMPWDLWRPTG